MKIFGIGSRFMNSKVVKFVSQKGKPNKYFVVLSNNDVYTLEEVEGVLNGK